MARRLPLHALTPPRKLVEHPVHTRTTIHTTAIEDALLAKMRSLPAIADVQAKRHVDGRASVGGEWRPLRLFTLDDFRNNRIGLVESARSR